MVYEAAEDSQLLISTLPEDLNELQVREIGCGSGVVSVACAKRGGNVVSVDIDEKAVEATKNLALQEKLSIEVILGDMFKPLAGRKFDLIVCNPPYLPTEEKDLDIALDGGVQGWEWIERFLMNVKEHLSEKGKVFLLYSNRTNAEQVHKLEFDNGFRRFNLAEKGVGLAEILYVDELRPYLARGKRGFTYTKERDGKLVLIKEHRPDADVDTIAIEALFLKLNTVDIGPRFISYTDGKLVREFVDGIRIDEFLEECSEQEARSVIVQTLEQCRKMDELGINKFEMTNPYKHILVRRTKTGLGGQNAERSNGVDAVMIDFERCRKTEKPKNITQFAQYLAKPEILEKLKRVSVIIDGEEVKRLATEYKRAGYSAEIFGQLLELFGE